MIQSDEMWHHYDGYPLEIHEITLDGEYKITILGKAIAQGQVPQYLVPKGHIFGSKIASCALLSTTQDDKEQLAQECYVLVGCTVAPGFDFNDFHLFSIEQLISQYPQFQDQFYSFVHSDFDKLTKET